MPVIPNPDIGTTQATNTYSRYLRINNDCVETDPCTPCEEPPCFSSIDKMFFLDSDVFTYQFNFAVESVLLKDIATGDTIIDLTAEWGSGNFVVATMSDVPADVGCFYIQVNEDCCFEFYFERVTDTQCEEQTLLIESTYPTVDCYGHNYNSGYSNRMRLNARILRLGSESDANPSRDEDEYAEEDIYNVWSFATMTDYPRNSFIQLMLEVVLRGFSLTVETRTQILTFEKYTGSIRTEVGQERDFFTRVELNEIKCKLKYLC